ncbi:hypothetical protein EJ08DRAFT_691611 [Tothia fuscella]|uniref:Uncharacterized protein n=1 Tax=Tothia fuscella TaxID=1048955 RepID=A0A9P4U342_9PEZI|nr:hypothetical protein EJ08DRAFT_691611 [Tothia fuscella]
MIVSVHNSQITAWCQIYAKEDDIKKGYSFFDGPFGVREPHIDPTGKAHRLEALANNWGVIKGGQFGGRVPSQYAPAPLKANTKYSFGTRAYVQASKTTLEESQAAEISGKVPAIEPRLQSAMWNIPSENDPHFCNNIADRIKPDHQAIVAHIFNITSLKVVQSEVDFIALRYLKARCLLFKRLEDRLLSQEGEHLELDAAFESRVLNRLQLRPIGAESNYRCAVNDDDKVYRKYDFPHHNADHALVADGQDLNTKSKENQNRVPDSERVFRFHTVLHPPERSIIEKILAEHPLVTDSQDLATKRKENQNRVPNSERIFRFNTVLTRSRGLFSTNGG